MKKVLSFGGIVLQVLLFTYVIIVIALLLCRNKYGYTQFGKYTLVDIHEQNVEGILNAKVGDLLVVSNKNVKKGDILYYYVVSEYSYAVQSDKVYQVNDGVYTIGNDQSIFVSNSRVLGKNGKFFPYIGGFIEVLESKGGFIIFISVPLLIAFIYHFYRLWGVFSKKKKSN